MDSVFKIIQIASRILQDHERLTAGNVFNIF